MRKILSLGASNSSKSINKTLAEYAANKVENAQVVLVDLNDYELPIYSADLEAESGIPENAVRFDKLIKEVDGIVLSLAEHNGLPTAAFKNLFDWVSRIAQDVWKNKPMLLMATSPGPSGGVNVLQVMKNLMPHFGGNVLADFSLPSFYENFADGQLEDEKLQGTLNEQIEIFKKNIG